jgi:hypothetical protein
MVADFQGDVLSGSSVRGFDPSALGLSAVDLKTLGTTAGNIIDLSRYSSLGFSVIYTIAGTTPTVGSVKLQAILYAEDGTTQISEPIDVVTIVSTQAAGTYRVYVGWGETLAAAMQAFSSGGTFTIGANLAALRAPRKVKLQLVVGTAYDQTGTKTADVYLQGRRVA